jgi:hypothetical protein
MDLSISSDPETDYLQIALAGAATDIEDMKLFVKRIYDEIMKHGIRKILLDYSKYQPPDPLIYQAQLVKFFPEELSEEIRHWKVAIVMDSMYKRIADFWELFAKNRGYSYKVFYSLEEAQTYMSQ